MTPIDPIDPKVEALKSLQASKMQQNRRVAEEGMERHADELNKENDKEKTSVDDVNKSEQGKIDGEEKNNSNQKKKNKNKKDDSGENEEDKKKPSKEPYKGNLLDIKG